MLWRLRTTVIRSPFHSLGTNEFIAQGSTNKVSSDNEVRLPNIFNLEPSTSPAFPRMNPMEFNEMYQHSIVVYVLSDRFLFTQPSSTARLRLLYHNQMRIRALNKCIATESTRISNDTFFSVWQFLCDEVGCSSMVLINLLS